MKRYLTISLAAVAMCAAGHAFAAEMDMSTIKCKDMAAMDPSTQAGIAAWMSGFVHGKANNPVIDSDKMTENMQKMADFCTKTPDATLMSAIDQSKM